MQGFRDARGNSYSPYWAGWLERTHRVRGEHGTAEDAMRATDRAYADGLHLVRRRGSGETEAPGS
jgi:hypothetical protein